MSRSHGAAVLPARLALLGVIAVGIAGCISGYPITGVRGAPDAAFAQSETAVTTAYFAGQHSVVVAYNDETNSQATIQYTPTTRKVLPGASLMGWSYSLDKGKTWTYGGKVQPPQGWPVLWGDPAVTTSQASYRYVFMSNLAIPSSKMPPGGIDGSVIVSGADSYIGGACIARSTDGGKTFAPYQCVSNTERNNVPNSEKGHFYDGGSMAGSNKGEIFAAFVDVTTNRVDVWRSPSASGQFAMLPTPFPNLDIVSHPRLRASYYDGALYVAALASNGLVYVTRFLNGQWTAPTQASDPVPGYPCVGFEPDACVSLTKLRLRTGPQFDFDIGAGSDDEGTDAIRFVYTRREARTNRLYVTASYCPLALGTCYPAPEWGTTPGNFNMAGDQFNPTVAAWRGFINLPPVWRAAYLDRDGSPSNTVNLRQGTLAYFSNGKRFHIPLKVYEDMPICPDLRGYWGDYDQLAHIGFEEGSTVALFLRAISDSSLGCPSRWEFWSNHLHLRALVFP